MTMEEEKIYQDKIFMLALAAAVFFLSPALWFKFTMDQALCNYSVWVWKTYHLPPYLGVWDQSFPGIFLLRRAMSAVFGESIFGFRLFDFLVQLSVCAMIYHLTKRLSGSRPAGFLAGVFYAIYYAGLGSRETGEREGYIFWLLLIALIAGLRWKERLWLRASLVGLLLGFAFLLKPFYGLSWPVFGIWFLAEGIKTRPRKVFLELPVYAFFCLVPAALVILYYWQLGSVKELYQATILYNFEVYRGSAAPNLSHLSSLNLIFHILHKDYIQQPLILFPALLIIVFLLLNQASVRDKKLFRILLALIAVSLISYRMQAKYFPDHLTPFIGLMTIFSGLGLAGIANFLKGSGSAWRDRIISAVFYPGVLVIMIAGINPQLIDYFAFDYFRPWAQVYSSGDSFDAQYFRTAKSLEPLLRKEKEIGYFGWHPLLPYLLKKKLPSRFCNVYHLLIRGTDGELSSLQKQWIREYTEAVIKDRPKFFLVADYVPDWDVFNLKSPGLKQAMHEQFPELESFVRENYQLYLSNSLLEVYVYYGK